MAHNRGTRRKPDWCGTVTYKGKRKWVGGCRTASEYNEAAEKARAELREQTEKPLDQRVPTVSEFAGAELLENGRIKMDWPDGQRCQKAEGRTAKSVLRMPEGLRPFLREFWDRPLDSFSRDEALTWLLARSPHVQQPVRQFFNHARERELIADNKFARPGASKRKRRVDRHDFEILSNEKYAWLLECARASRSDDYGLVIQGIVLCEGETAMRPSEIFALHVDEVDFREGGDRSPLPVGSPDRRAGRSEGPRSTLGDHEPRAAGAPGTDAALQPQDPVPRDPRWLLFPTQLVRPLERGPRRRRDARPRVL
jgi:hypothetical protein